MSFIEVYPLDISEAYSHLFHKVTWNCQKAITLLIFKMWKETYWFHKKVEFHFENEAEGGGEPLSGSKKRILVPKQTLMLIYFP